MGYSISATVRGKNHHKMLAFLKANFRPFGDLTSEKAHRSLGDPSDDLSYDHGRGIIGFDYQSGLSDWERQYAYALCRWVAIKAGLRKTRFRGFKGPKGYEFEPTPFMTYDGYEDWPILVVQNVAETRRLPKAIRWCATTPLGMRLGKEGRDTFARACSSCFFDPKIAPAFNRDWAALGAMPQNDEPARQKWLDARNVLIVKHCKVEITTNVTLILNELKRLDGLWRAV